MKIVATLAVGAALLIPQTAGAAMHTGLEDQGYKSGIILCTTTIWSDGTQTEACRTQRWCKGTLVNPRKCVHVAPWTIGTRSG